MAEEVVIGIVSRILRLSLERAMREGRTSVSWEDVAHAYRAWQVIKKTLPGVDGKSSKKRDPFAKGPDARTIEAVNRKIAADSGVQG